MGFLGEFSKGNETAKSANFSESGGENCSNKCKLKARTAEDKKGMCYAVKTEKMYPTVKKAGIAKRKLSPVQICNGITLEARKLRRVWLRFSVLGSLPMIKRARATKGFESAFKNMIQEIESAECDVHLPIEEPKKAAYYQKLISEVSDKIVVRETCQTEKRLMKATNHRAFVIGEYGTTMQERLNLAHAKAKEIRETGQKAVVCPAVRERNFKGRKTKCGDCKACASQKVDVVLYPLH